MVVVVVGSESGQSMEEEVMIIVDSCWLLCAQSVCLVEVENLAASSAPLHSMSK